MSWCGMCVCGSSCEALVVRLNFPNDARASDIDLIVKRDYLRAISKTQYVRPARCVSQLTPTRALSFSPHSFAVRLLASQPLQ